MNTSSDSPDSEFDAIKAIYLALEPLGDDARTRIINYIIARLDIATEVDDDDEAVESSSEVEAQLKQEQGRAPKYSTFAELFDAAEAKSNGDKALLAGYWLQVCQGQDNFDGQSANRELKHLGEGLANVTVAASGLMGQKPALVVQLRKSGRSQQARKTYKVTAAGIRAVESMIGR